MRQTLGKLAAIAAPLFLLGCGGGGGVLFSNSTYNFGTVVLNTTTTLTGNRSVVSITNSATAPVSISTSLSGNGAFTLQPSLSCGPTLNTGSSCVVVVTFTPAAAGNYSAKLTVVTGGDGAAATNTVAIAGTAASLSQGASLVQATDNPQVMLYTWYPPVAGNVSVNFGPTTTYGHVTSTVAATGAAPVSLYIAGMLQNTQYHMQAQLLSGAGQTLTDTDHAMTTGAWPAVSLPQVQATTTTGYTPSPGVELMNVANALDNIDLPLYITDLSGNLLWAYHMRDADYQTTIPQSPRQLPNGDLLFQQSPPSQDALTTSNFGVNVLREIDLAGNIVRELSVGSLNAKLVAANYQNLQLQTIHHEVIVLPNGHVMVFGNVFKSISNLTGYSAPVNVLGDVVIDLDPNWNPVWVWNAFDHLDPNYHPAAAAFPDWTHCNAIQYEPDDGNILISCRHLSWIIKIHYANGTGDGAVMWRMGNNGDLTLVNGTAPIDWQYAQHYIHIISPQTAGNFDMTMIDNGDYRFDSTGAQVCQQLSGTNCYTTIPVFRINEAAKTATVIWRDTLPPSQYNFFGGQAQQLANGDIEFTLSAQEGNVDADTYEVTYDNNKTVVWHLMVKSQNAYRGGRVLGIYPNVPW